LAIGVGVSLKLMYEDIVEVKTGEGEGEEGDILVLSLIIL
jgi:hypothetical protein